MVTIWANGYYLKRCPCKFYPDTISNQSGICAFVQRVTRKYGHFSSRAARNRVFSFHYLFASQMSFEFASIQLIASSRWVLSWLTMTEYEISINRSRYKLAQLRIPYQICVFLAQASGFKMSSGLPLTPPPTWEGSTLSWEGGRHVAEGGRDFSWEGGRQIEEQKKKKKKKKPSRVYEKSGILRKISEKSAFLGNFGSNLAKSPWRGGRNFLLSGIELGLGGGRTFVVGGGGSRSEPAEALVHKHKKQTVFRNFQRLITN